MTLNVLSVAAKILSRKKERFTAKNVVMYWNRKTFILISFTYKKR